MTKQNGKTRKSANVHRKGHQIHGPLLSSELKFDKHIDIPNPKLQSDGTLIYSLFANSSNSDISPSVITNNAHYPELEKLSRKINKAFKKKAAKYLLKKQKELNDTSIQLSIASANGGLFLTYTNPDTEKN